MNVCFVCETPFQIMNCINYAYHQKDFERMNADIYIGDMFYQFEEMVSRLRKEKVFQNVYGYSYRDESGIVEHYKSKIEEIFFQKRYLQSLIKQDVKLSKKSYDYIYISMTTHFGIAIVLAFPDAVVRYYDDGLASYIGAIGAECLPEKRKKLYKFAGKDYRRLQPDALYVNNKALCRTTVTNQIFELYPVMKGSAEFRQILYRVFNYQKEPLYDQRRFIYLSQPNHSGLEEVDRIEQCIEEKLMLCEEECVVRLHPRQKKWEKDMFAVDQKRNLWELTCAEQMKDHHVLIGQFSTAQVTPKMFFNKEPWLIFTYKLFADTIDKDAYKNFEALISDIRKAYTNPEKIIVVSNIGEFKAALKEVKNEQ